MATNIDEFRNQSSLRDQYLAQQASHPFHDPSFGYNAPASLLHDAIISISESKLYTDNSSKWAPEPMRDAWCEPAIQENQTADQVKGGSLRRSTTDENSYHAYAQAFMIGLLLGILLAGVVLATVLTMWLYYPDTCSPSCVNGNCSSFNICQCNTGWYGSTCALPNCTNPCQNNGTCVAPNICNCTSSYNGSFCQTFVGFFLSFDNSLQDLYNTYNGNSSSGISYVSPGYNGAGTCLWLNSSSTQSVTISTPFLNLVNASFTFEMWIYPQTLCNNTSCMDNDILSQFNQGSRDRALQLTIRIQHVFFGFYTDDTTGTQTLSVGQWYHLAFVYDLSIRTQYIYINGNLDVSRGSAGPYQGGNGSVTIGTGPIHLPNNYFDGCLDSIAYINRAKNATEVLKDATLVASLSFDGSTLLDSGPLLINGTGVNYSYTSSGRVNAALVLSTLSSYVQITGLLRLGTQYWPYSLAIWIYPNNSSGGTIMHMSSRTDGAQTSSAWCLAMMGLTSSGQIVINSWNNMNIPIIGPQVSLNTWTHVVATYSPTNGERLYVNGTLSNSSVPYNFLSANTPMTVTLGSSLLGTGVCSSGGIQTGQFYGSLDEFYLYARELSAADVNALANP